ncbi:MAG: methionine--tRNA ligase [Thermoplasmata archaeon]|nr:methionine--tRNA ligase [Thermoplasmata archaeon]
MADRRKIFIGAAWPYANGEIHLGHLAGCLLPADIFARYSRMRGYDTLFVSGSDMHGTPITVTADKNGLTPEEVANRNHASILRSIELLDISYDIYTSTHTENHFKVVQEIFNHLMENGLIDSRTEEAPYCPTCRSFKPDRYVEGICPHCKSDGARGDQCDGCGQILDPKDLISPRCKICATAPEFRETEHFYLLLTKLEGKIKQFIEENRDRWRPNTRNNTENFIREGLRDRAITRDLNWGVPIPLEGYEDKRIYVWFEAVCGYLSASREYSQKKGQPDLWEDYWKDEACRHYYFLAKDNIPFHTIIWPAILIGYGGLDLPYDIPSNEYLQWDGEQFSKSRGHGVTVNGFLQDHPVDALRFYLSVNMPESRDSNFDLKEFVQKNNTELLGAFGNYLHRVVTFISRNYGEVPARGPLSEEDRKIIDLTKERYTQAMDAMELVHLKEGSSILMSLVNDANRYFNNSAPWKVIKEDRDRCGTILSVALQVAKTVVYGFHPYIPHATARWCEMTGIDTPGLWTEGLEPFPEGHKLAMPEPLFTKLELPEEESTAGENNEKNKDIKGEGEKMTLENEEGIVTFDEFMRNRLKVGKILEVNDHPKADRLYVLSVDLGEEAPRTLVAGLKEYYKKEDMMGKHIIVVSNLKPARMRGVESQGMLLAAEKDGVVSLLTLDRMVPPGSEIH